VQAAHSSSKPSNPPITASMRDQQIAPSGPKKDAQKSFVEQILQAVTLQIVKSS